LRKCVDTGKIEKVIGLYVIFYFFAEGLLPLAVRLLHPGDSVKQRSSMEVGASRGSSVAMLRRSSNGGQPRPQRKPRV
jgi:hypothetical protein